MQKQENADSLAKAAKNQPKKEISLSSSKRHHPKSTVQQTPIDAKNATAIKPAEKKIENAPVTIVPEKVPLQIANSDNIEFKLLSAAYI